MEIISMFSFNYEPLCFHKLRMRLYLRRERVHLAMLRCYWSPEWTNIRRRNIRIQPLQVLNNMCTNQNVEKREIIIMTWHGKRKRV